MSSPPRSDAPGLVVWRPWVRMEYVVSGIVVLLSVCGLFSLAYAFRHAQGNEDRLKAVEAIHQQQGAIIDAINELKAETRVLKAQNIRSMDDRDGIHENQGAVNASLKRLEDGMKRLEARK